MVNVAGEITKDAASPEALRRLNRDLEALRLEASLPLLKAAVKELQSAQPDKALDYASKAVTLNEGHGYSWYVLAICQEKLSDFTGALLSYERALQLMPENEDLVLDLGRLALALKLPDMAEKFFSRHLARNPGALDAVNNLACALREQSRFAEGVELLRPYIYAHPEHAPLWNTLGSMLSEQGEVRQALTFYDEALRLSGAFPAALHNRASAKLAIGDAVGARADSEQAAELSSGGSEKAMIRFALSQALMVAGEIEAGWQAYEVRHDRDYACATVFAVEGPRWSTEQDLRGRRLFVVGEQGLGDEVLFANALSDVIDALGPQGALTLAVEPRLVALMQRSFPQARVVRHGTWGVRHRVVRGVPDVTLQEYDCWVPIGSLMPRFRPSLDVFPTGREGFLKADSGRVDHWRRTLAAMGSGPKVGVLWKSLKMDATRTRFFSPFEHWRQVLQTPGVGFVNLQYGDCAEELARAGAEFGVDIVQPPEIDLKQDLDDLAALCCALDLTIGPATATTNIAAAAGAPTWFISTPDAWPRLGTDAYPWYPQARVFAPACAYDWGEVMGEVAVALRETFPAAN